MIITVTLNPAIDRTIVLDKEISIGTKNKGIACGVEPGGGGIHTSRAIKALGGESLIMSFSAGSNGRYLRDTITSMDILHDFTDVPGQTRVNVHVYDGNGIRTDIHEPGYHISDGDFLRFLERVKLCLDKDNIFIIGGSIPNGLSFDNVKLLYKTIKKAGCKLIVETEEEALIESFSYNPDWVVCDKWRIMEAYHREVNTPEDALKFAEDFISHGAKGVCISLEEKGTLLVMEGEEPVFATIPEAKPYEYTIALLDGMTGALATALTKKYSFDDTAKFIYAMGYASAKLEGTGMQTLLNVFHDSQQTVLYTF